MKYALILLTLFITTAIYAQESNETPRFGLYIRDKTKAIHSMSPSIVCDAKSDRTILTLEKPSAVLYLNNTYSETHTYKGPVDFLFFFVDSQNTQPLTAPGLQFMLKNRPFVYADTPSNFVLARLFTTKEKRALRIEKEKILSGIRYTVFSQDVIPFTAIPINEHSFLVILDHPLPPGEYGFIYQGDEVSGDAIGRPIYDFSIEK